MSKRTVQTLILLVDNEFGVLTRVTAQVRREGWNIKSLAVAETMDPTVSRLTISVECLDSALPGVLMRIGRLVSVRAITAYADVTHICRELILATAGPEGREGVESAAREFGARTEEIAGGGLLVEYSGPTERVNALAAALRPCGVHSIARSGAVTLERPAATEVEP